MMMFFGNEAQTVKLDGLNSEHFSSENLPMVTLIRQTKKGKSTADTNFMHFAQLHTTASIGGKEPEPRVFRARVRCRNVQA